MSNPGGVDLNSSPYFDDYDEDKKFVRILFRPGRAVQARELTQLQTIFQKQIQRFGSYFFKEGAVIDGCEQGLDLNLPYIKLQTNYNGTEVDVEDFVDRNVISANTGVRATVGLATDEEGNDPKTLFINYTSSGTVVLNVSSIPANIVAGNTVYVLSANATGTIDHWNTDLMKIFVTNVTGTIIPGAPVSANTIDSTGANVSFTITGGVDARTSKEFGNNEVLVTTEAPLIYANTATSFANSYVEDGILYTRGSKISIGNGVIYISDHFIKHTNQIIILDKYKNVPTYKVGVIPQKTFLDYLDDVSLVDNAQGTPNYQAPGADRYKIETVLTKIDPTVETAETEFITLTEIENGEVKKRKSFGLESKLEEVISRRTYEESGDYTLSNPKISIREHLLQGDNNGRYSSTEGGDNNLLLLEIDPFIAYVRGYRNEFLIKSLVEIEKGLDQQSINQNKTQINIGNYVEVDEVVGSWDIMQATKVDLYNTAFNSISSNTYSSTSVTGTKIGEARVRGIEYISGDVGTSSAKFRLYLFDITMNSGQYFQDVRTIYDSSTPNRIADIVLNSQGNAVLYESAFNNAIFSLPYDAVKTLRDEDGVVQSGFTFKKEFDVTFTAGIATVSSGDNNESFIGTGALSATQKNENYIVVVNNSGTDVATSTLSGTVQVGAGSNTVNGSSTFFTTQLNVGDIIRINSLSRKVAAIANNTSLTLDVAHTSGAAAGNTYVKILPSGSYMNLAGNGGSGSVRSVNVLTPGTIQVDVKENATFTGKIIATLNRTSAKEMQKLLQPNSTVTINANTHPNSFGGPYSLGKSDVYQIRGIYQSSGFAVAPSTSNTDVTANYIFDNGQRDNTYEHGTITPKLGIVPSGQLLVVFDYFTHDTSQGVGYLSVDSYPIDDVNTSNTTIDTADIPKYTSTTTGYVYDLRNSIDFRLRKTDSASTTNPTDPGTYQIPIGGLHIPKQYSDFEADMSIYKGRVSKLYLTENGEFAVLDGSPGYPVPQVPPSVPGTLDLAIIDVPPYPSSPINVVIEPQKNRRYTMKDIGRIEDRVNKLEYYASLNTLERQAADVSILDENGIERFKNSVLVDSFIGHNVADVKNSDLKASIDTKNKFVTAQARLDEIPLKYVSSGSSRVYKTTDNKVILQYSSNTFSENRFASTPLNLSQKLALNWTGTLSVHPSTDNWMDTINYPNKNLVVVDLQGNADNWRVISNAWDTEYNSWESRWVGVPIQQDVGSTKSNVNRIFDSSTESELVGSTITVGPTESQTQARTVDVSVNHFMRGRDFIYRATGLKKNAKMYVFLDGVNVTANCKQVFFDPNYVGLSDLYELIDDNGYVLDSPGAYTTKPAANSNYVDSNGEIVGIFTLPDQKFTVGQHELKLTDSATNSNTATTVAKNIILSQGLSVISSPTLINTRPSNINFASSIEKSNVAKTSDVRDPVSQSFYVDETRYPYGIYVTNIGISFKTKSSVATDKVYLQIREMENGFPTRKAIGDATTFLTANNITASSNGNIFSTFTFSNPVYLLSGVDYCFSLLPEGNSDKFEVWTAELGATNLANGARIDKQPAAGTLFTLSNGTQWSSRLNQDITYVIQIAKFNTSTQGTVLLQNKNASSEKTYSAFIPNISTIEPEKTSVRYSTNVSDENGTLTGFFNVSNLEKVKLAEEKTLLLPGDEANNSVKSISVSATLSTNNQFVSPCIDLERLNVITQDFSINNSTSNTMTGTATFTNGSIYVTGTNTAFTSELSIGQYVSFGGTIKRVSSIISNSNVAVTAAFTANGTNVIISKNNEENPSGPYTAQSRYITRRVELVDGFEANDLIVYLDANRPAGTNIKVYYKILSEFDTDNFDDKLYTEMVLDGTATFTADQNEYVTEKYTTSSAARTGGTQLLSGTLSVGSSSTTVNGTSTRFSEELRIGDTIRVGNDNRVITAISGNLQLTVESPFSVTSSGLTGFKVLNNAVTYTTVDNRTYSGYKYFAIKIVFLSDNVAIAPRVKKLKVISIT